MALSIDEAIALSICAQVVQVISLPQLADALDAQLFVYGKSQHTPLESF